MPILTNNTPRCNTRNKRNNYEKVSFNSFEIKCNSNKLVYFLLIILLAIILTSVRRNEAIYCLIGFGIGVASCLFYHLIKRLLNVPIQQQQQQQDDNYNNTHTLLKITSKSTISMRPRQRRLQHKHNTFGLNSMQVPMSVTDSGIEIPSKNTTLNDTDRSSLSFTSSSSSSTSSDYKRSNSNLTCKSHLNTSSSYYDDDDNDYDDESLYEYELEKDEKKDDAIEEPLSQHSSASAAEKCFDKALDHIDKLKEDMNHLCTDIDLLYKNHKNTDDSTHSTHAPSTKQTQSYYLCDKNNDLFDWNMHDVLNSSSNEDSTTTMTTATAIKASLESTLNYKSSLKKRRINSNLKLRKYSSMNCLLSNKVQRLKKSTCKCACSMKR